MSKGLPWFRMYTDFLEDPKVVTLAFEDQRHFIGVLALKSAGTLDQECSPELRDRLVAQRLWIDHSAIREVKRRLIEAQLINEDWQPTAWDKRQFVSDHDPTAAERARRYREKQKKKQPSRVTSRKENGSVTPLDTDTEQSGEGDNPAPQNPKKDPHAPDKPEFISDELWAEFKSYRTKKKAPLTKKAWTIIENQLVAGMDRGYGPEEMLAETMAAGWQAFRLDWYENRVRYFGGNKPQPDAKDSLIEQASRLRAVQ